MVSALDAYVGRIVAALEAQGVAYNTLIFFTSDYGREKPVELFDEHGG
jgi:arylsulfatase A-like enzyme